MDIIKITDFMSEDLIELNLKNKTKEFVLEELANLLANSDNIQDSQAIKKALIERENIGSTGIGKGVAIPHAKTESAKNLTVGLGISKGEVDFDSIDGEKTKIFFVFASPLKDNQVYLKVLARISRLIRNETFRLKLLNCKTAQEIMKCISIEENI